MVSRNAIGFFDSGIGGVTIWREVAKLLPQYHTIYLADSKNAPYGVRSVSEIIDISIRNTAFLIDQGAAMVVVACNTATTQAIKVLREKFDIPFVGIEPAVKPAAARSETGVIGVLATRGTLESEHFNNTRERFSGNTRVILRDGDGIVGLIESGQMNSPEMNTLLRKHLSFFQNDPVDHLVLGCTHYPLISDQISAIMGKEVAIVDPGKAVAGQCKRLLETHAVSPGEPPAKHRFFTTGTPDVFLDILKNLGWKNAEVNRVSFK